ncbi:hypothetical protein [Bacteroides caecimuris]|nr:hypothetical protein [Bacteroides caecimuris]QQR19354.1 hypothetical protein I5Q79_09245 [Bacteroides caecimuris]UQA32062.1 hypothetical protein M2854_09335 [Bacteroides caecimuris]
MGRPDSSYTSTVIPSGEGAPGWSSTDHSKLMSATSGSKRLCPSRKYIFA